LGGGEKSRERHVSRGKLLPRDRVHGLLDPGSPFLELGALAANGMYGNDAPGAGVVAGMARRLRLGDASGQTHMQVLRLDDGAFLLEHRDGSAARHFRATTTASAKRTRYCT